MHELRSAILTGDPKPALDPHPQQERCRRKGASSLFDVPIPRGERRKADQRREQRFQGVVERATINFRRKTLLVPVINVSGGGVMLETGILPCIGEIIVIALEGRKPLDGIVRWVKEGRVGLDLGEGTLQIR